MQKLLVFLKKAENKCTWASHRASGLVQYSTITQHSAPTYNSNFFADDEGYKKRGNGYDSKL